jgi:hypothetical protein
MMKRLMFLLVVAVCIAAVTLSMYAQDPDVKRSGQYYVQVYLQENYKGKMVRVPVPAELINEKELQKLGIPNDSIQSLKVPAGVSITLYDGAGFGGKNQTYTENTPTLGDMRSITSSIKTALVGK